MLTRLEPLPITVVIHSMDVLQYPVHVSPRRWCMPVLIASLFVFVGSPLVFANDESEVVSAPAAADEATVDQADVTTQVPEEVLEEVPELVAEELSPEAVRYGFLERQIHLGEHKEVLSQLSVTVEQIEQAGHRYHEDLIVPLTLLGDAHVIDTNYAAALDNYDRARHIARVSYGLFDSRQIPLVYRQASTFNRAGDAENAIRSEEYAYEVQRRNLGATSTELLPGLHRLADAYLRTHNLLAARSLYNRGVKIHDANGTSLTADAVPSLEGIAESFLLQRFPPIYIKNASDNDRLRGPQSGLHNREIMELPGTIVNYSAGERALQQVVEIRQQQQPPDHEATKDALLGLADWHLMFGRGRTAGTLYSHVYKLMSEHGQDPNELFGQPELLHYPVPRPPDVPPIKDRPEPVEGFVTLQFDVSVNGRAVNLNTLQAIPQKPMEFRVRRSMREGVYRPQFVDGSPVVVPKYTFTHKFLYYPKQQPTAEDAPTSDSVTEDTTAAEPGPNSDAASDETSNQESHE